MAATVIFNGYFRLKPGHTYPTRPYGWDWAPGDTRVFNTALAHEYGRPDGNDGADWADLFCAAENHAMRDADPPAFRVLSATEADALTAAAAAAEAESAAEATADDPATENDQSAPEGKE